MQTESINKIYFDYAEVQLIFALQRYENLAIRMDFVIKNHLLMSKYLLFRDFRTYILFPDIRRACSDCA